MSKLAHIQLTSMLNEYGLTAKAREFLDANQKMYIDGQFVDSISGTSMPVFEPCSGEQIAVVPAANTQDVDIAVNAAQRTFKAGEWHDMSPASRERLLHRLADLMQRDLQTIAEIESLDAGKAIEGCKAVDVQGSIDLLRYMAGWATKIEGTTKKVSVPGQHFSYTLREPVGVVAAIVPWNWPLNMGIWKLAAPLAAGCTLVLKPAQLTPLSMLYFAKLCAEAGMPPGVINIITGDGSDVGAYLVGHPAIQKVSFTGSTPVGQIVGKSAINNISHVTLELGGKSPMVALADASIDKVVQATLQSVFFNTGQVCSAGSRLYVHLSIYHATLKALSERLASLKVGATLDPTCDMGPTISVSHHRSVMRYIKLALDEGATLACGHQNFEQNNDRFIYPTVLADCHNGMTSVQEEIFGPVLCVIPFEHNDEALQWANDSIYALAASVFTENLSLALTFVNGLEAGTVWVNTHDLIDANTPFGGFKQSGIGKDLGHEQLDHYLETKSVWIEV